jgi:putative acetyltransferase
MMAARPADAAAHLADAAADTADTCLRQPTKAELRLITQRVALMRKNGLLTTVMDELDCAGLTLAMPWQQAESPLSQRDTPEGVCIRCEEETDHVAIADLLRAAFPTAAEALLVERLRVLPTHEPALFLVAVAEGRVVGHAAISHVDAPGATQATACLATLAVDAAWRQRGVGTALALTGLDRCRRHSVCAVFAQGRGVKWGRFGFRPLAKAWPRLASKRAHNEVGIELLPGALAHAKGGVNYPAAAWEMGTTPPNFAIDSAEPEGLVRKPSLVARESEA